MNTVLQWMALRPALSTLFFTAFGLMLIGSVSGCASEEAPSKGLRVYVGTGSDNPEDGIYTYRFNPDSGTLTRTQDVTPLLNPTFLTLSPDGQHLYSVSETADSATIHALNVDPSTGTLSPINAVPAEGGAPCYISTDATGQWVLTANYLGGNVAVFPVQDDGSLGPASQVVQHNGSDPNPERQTAPHAHYFQVDPQNQYALASDLGTDEVRIYPFDAETGRLDTANVRVVPTPPGTGPRHLAFHPNGKYVYLIGELRGTVTVFEYEASAGRMQAVQTVSTVPEEFEGAAASADIHVHPSGDFLYASNRGDANDIVHYAIDESTGQLTFAGRQQSSITWPRNFAIAPSGTYLLAANRRADTITVFRIDPDTGALSDTGQSISVPAPTRIAFAPSSGE